MKKKLFLITTLVLALICVFAISVSAAEITQAEADKYYYDKVYVTADGQHELDLYEKVGDTYYPLVWFSYDILGEDGTTVVETKYVKVRLEDVTCYSEAYSQGRFNGVYYEYTDKSGNTMVLDSSNAVLLNLRSGKMAKTTNWGGTQKSTNVTIEKFEWSKGSYPKFSKLEAVYIPLSVTSLGGNTIVPSSVRVYDIDRNHGALEFPTKAFQHSKIKEIFIPGSATFPSGANSQFQQANLLETVIFGKGFAQNIPNYCFQATNLKKVFFLGTEDELNAITVSTTQNNPYHSLTKKSFAEYMLLSEDEKKDGRYLVYEVPECYALGHLGEVVNACVSQCTICDEIIVNHSKDAELAASAVYANYATVGKKITACQTEGCTYQVEEELEALITSEGFSVPEKKDVATSFSIKYTVNSTAVETYKELAGKEIKYGLFIAIEEYLGDQDILEAAKTTNGILVAETPNNYTVIELKIGGFADDALKTETFAIGAYIVETDLKDETTKVSYIEKEEPAEGKTNAFISFDYIVEKYA